MQNVKMDIKTAKEKSIQGNKNLKYHNLASMPQPAKNTTHTEARRRCSQVQVIAGLSFMVAPCEPKN